MSKHGPLHRRQRATRWAALLLLCLLSVLWVVLHHNTLQRHTFHVALPGRTSDHWGDGQAAARAAAGSSSSSSSLSGAVPVTANGPEPVTSGAGCQRGCQWDPAAGACLCGGEPPQPQPAQDQPRDAAQAQAQAQAQQAQAQQAQAQQAQAQQAQAQQAQARAQQAALLRLALQEPGQARPGEEPAAAAAAQPRCPPHASQASRLCGGTGISSQSDCEARGCCWQASGRSTACFDPPGSGDGDEHSARETYRVAARTEAGGGAGLDLSLRLVQGRYPKYGDDFRELSVMVRHEAPARLRVRIAPTGSSRWEVPEWLLPRPGPQEFDQAEALYKAQLPEEGQPFEFAVLRCRQGAGAPGGCGATGAVFNTSGFNMVFKDQYIQLSTHMSMTTTTFGLGQHTPREGSLKLVRSGRPLALFNHDLPSSKTGVNLYGSHPFLLQVEQDGTSSGVLLLNSNPMDVVPWPTKLTYKVVGGLLDLYFFMGPSPEQVLRQYQEVAGRPAMPPYWSLGFHHSRWGYSTLASLREAVGRYREAGLPLETVWSDIDHMDRFRDFTLDPERYPPAEMRSFVEGLHAAGQRWVPIVDCGIPVAEDDEAYRSGAAAGVFLKDRTGKPYLGQVWPGAVHYPDFLSANVTWPWWQAQLARMHAQVPFDGIWIDMNEPSNFCTGEVCVRPDASLLHQALHRKAGGSRGGAGASPTARALAQAAQAEAAGGDNDDDDEAQAPAAAAAAGAAAGGNASAAAPPSSADSEAERLRALSTCSLECQLPPDGDRLAHPPYAVANGVRGTIKKPRALGRKTVAMSAVGVDGATRQYDAHNLYGLGEAAATRRALRAITRRRPFLLTRSTFVGSGALAAHWGGDNTATWADLQQSVPAMLNAALLGLGQSGSDICGFLGDTTEELCTRWFSAGAFYPFARTHNSLFSAPQEPYLWPGVAAAARRALRMRYRLLPHLYSWAYRAHVAGGVVAQPLLLQFPGDHQARSCSDQWLLGDGVLVSPVLQQGAAGRRAYLPQGTWYDLWEPSRPPLHGPAALNVSAPPGEVPLHLRGGSVLALQQPGNTTAAVRASPLTLVLPLDTSARGARARQTGVPAQQCSDLPETLAPRVAGGDGGGGGGGGARAGGAVAAAQRALLAEAAGGGGAGSGLALVGCGLLFLDSGDSLEVPAPGGASLTLRLTAAAAPDLGRGWLRATPVEGGAAAAAAAARRQRRRRRLRAVGGGGGAAAVHVPDLQELMVLGLPALGRARAAAAAAAAAASPEGPAPVPDEHRTLLLQRMQGGAPPQPQGEAPGTDATQRQQQQQQQQHQQGGGGHEDAAHYAKYHEHYSSHHDGYDHHEAAGGGGGDAGQRSASPPGSGDAGGSGGGGGLPGPAGPGGRGGGGAAPQGQQPQRAPQPDELPGSGAAAGAAPATETAHIFVPEALRARPQRRRLRLRRLAQATAAAAAGAGVDVEGSSGPAPAGAAAAAAAAAPAAAAPPEAYAYHFSSYYESTDGAVDGADDSAAGTPAPAAAGAAGQPGQPPEGAADGPDDPTGASAAVAAGFPAPSGAASPYHYHFDSYYEQHGSPEPQAARIADAGDEEEEEEEEAPPPPRPPPPAAAGGKPAGEAAVAVWVDGRRVPAEHVVFEDSSGVLRVLRGGLAGSDLAHGLRVEWRAAGWGGGGGAGV